ILGVDLGAVHGLELILDGIAGFEDLRGIESHGSGTDQRDEDGCGESDSTFHDRTFRLVPFFPILQCVENPGCEHPRRWDSIAGCTAITIWARLEPTCPMRLARFWRFRCPGTVE